MEKRYFDVLDFYQKKTHSYIRVTVSLYFFKT